VGDGPLVQADDPVGASGEERKAVLGDDDGVAQIVQPVEDGAEPRGRVGVEVG
jgi:hypothetical protein